MRKIHLLMITLMVTALVIAACGGTSGGGAAPAAPKQEAPKQEAPKAAAPTEAPKPAPTQAPAPKQEAPKATEAPKTAAPASAPAAKADAGKPIRIGASLSLTGRLERTGKEQQNGYKLWEEEVNAKGGVLGRKVEFVIYDDKSDPETGAKLYEKLITEDKVDLVLGPYGSPVALAASTVTEKYKYTMLAPGASASEIWGRGYKYVFAVYAPAPNYLTGAIEMAKAKGYTTAAVINENSAFAKDTVRGAIETAEKAGFKIVYKEEYSRDVKDLTPTLTKIKALNPDVLLAGTYGEDATLIVRQSKDLNWAPKMIAMTVGPALPDFYQTLKTDAEHIMGSSQWEPVIKGVEGFVDAYKKKNGYEPGYHAAGGYGAGQILQQAIEKAGAVDNEKLRDVLQKEQFNSTFGPYKVDATGNNTAGAIYIVQWQKGERKVVWPDKAANAPATIPFPAWNAR